MATLKKESTATRVKARSTSELGSVAARIIRAKNRQLATSRKTQFVVELSKEESERFVELLTQPRKPVSDRLKLALIRYNNVVQNP